MNFDPNIMSHGYRLYLGQNCHTRITFLAFTAVPMLFVTLRHLLEEVLGYLVAVSFSLIEAEDIWVCILEEFL